MADSFLVVETPLKKYGSSMIRMEAVKKCSKCKNDKSKESFSGDNMRCDKCLKAQRDYQNRHRERMNEEQRIRYENDEEYRKKKLERTYRRNTYIVSCDVCNCSISQGHFGRHLNTTKHQHNLGKIQAEEQ